VPNFTNGERIAFTEDMDRYMAKEVAAEERSEWVENKANELFAGDYSPFMPENVQEAISELCFADAMLLGAYLYACASHPDNDVSATTLADFLVDRSNTYWRAAAIRRATVLEDEREI